MLRAWGGLLDVKIRPSGGVGRLGTSLVDIVLYSYRSSKDASTFILVWIVREGSRLSSCLVLETTIPPFILRVVNVVLSDSPGSSRVFIDDSEG